MDPSSILFISCKGYGMARRESDDASVFLPKFLLKDLTLGENSKVYLDIEPGESDSRNFLRATAISIAPRLPSS